MPFLMLFMPIFRPAVPYFLISSLILFSLPSYAEYLDQVIKAEESTQQAAVNSQKIIDGLSDKTRKLLNQYRATHHQTETLITYNQHLRDLLASQKKEQVSLKQQLKDIEVTQREIIPLILNMLDSLDKFVTLDLPFLPEERKQRLAKLKSMVIRADVTNAEKFRRIIEAYQIENDYGNTIEAYRSDLSLNGVSSSVDFLRLGRVALYYQRFDGSESGFWDKKKNQWQMLSSDYHNDIRKGLRIARKETAPDLLTLPIPLAEAVQ